jgi:hypothetical protein
LLRRWFALPLSVRAERGGRFPQIGDCIYDMFRVNRRRAAAAMAKTNGETSSIFGSRITCPPLPARSILPNNPPATSLMPAVMNSVSGLANRHAGVTMVRSVLFLVFASPIHTAAARGYN